MKRREFLQTSALAAAPARPAAAAPDSVPEPARNIPVAEEDDVVVCSGSAAAEHRKKVELVVREIEPGRTFGSRPPRR